MEKENVQELSGNPEIQAAGDTNGTTPRSEKKKLDHKIYMRQYRLDKKKQKEEQTKKVEPNAQEQELDKTEAKKLANKARMRAWRDKQKKEGEKNKLCEAQNNEIKEPNVHQEIDQTEAKRLANKVRMRQWREKQKKMAEDNKLCEGESLPKCSKKAMTGKERQQKRRMKLSEEEKTKYLEVEKLKRAMQREKETTENKEKRLLYQRLHQIEKLKNETEAQYMQRLNDVGDRNEEKISKETVEERKARLMNANERFQAKLSKESEDDRQLRLQQQNTYDEQKIARESSNDRLNQLSKKKADYEHAKAKETSAAKKKRLFLRKGKEKEAYSLLSTPKKLEKQKKMRVTSKKIYTSLSPHSRKLNIEKNKKGVQNLRKKLKTPAEKNLDRLLKQYQRKITQECFLGYVCVCEQTLKERAAVVLVKPNNSEHYLTHIRLDEATRSMDGKHYICKNCDKALKGRKIPLNAESKRELLCDSFPDEMVSDPEMKLNKLEAYLLKKVIPFMRIGRIPKSNEIKLFGNQIFAEADIKGTLEKILPIRQLLIAVAFKRRAQYESSFIKEVISRPKVLKYFKYLVDYNHLYKDAEFSQDKLLQFELEICQEAAKNETKVQAKEKKPSVESAELDLVEEAVELILEEQELPDLPDHINTNDMDTIVIPDFNNYSAPTPTLSTILARAIMECDRQPNRLVSPEVVILAPGEGQSIVRYRDTQHLEEKAFPHLFPTGTGGYLSTHAPKNTSFARYYRNRLLSIDSRFREDTSYLIFLMLVKEKILLSQSIATYFRKASKSYSGGSVKDLAEKHRDEIIRLNLGFQVFKNVRGFSPYFHGKKQNIMAMIRQLGMPRIFFTFSSGELQWHDLIRNVLRFNHKGGEIPDVDQMSNAQKRKIINDNILLVTDHFFRRANQIINFMKNENALNTFGMKDFFHRTEFQMRGAPHLHGLGWLQDTNGFEAPEYDVEDPESKFEVEKFVDTIISCSLQNDDEEVNELVKRLQMHHHTKSCRKKRKYFHINPKNGHDKGSGDKTGTMIKIQSCRFGFPRMPMRKTTLIIPPTKDEKPENLKVWHKNYERIRDYMHRQLFTEDASHVTDEMSQFFELSFDEFLAKLGLSERQYLDALRIDVKKKGATVFLKRHCSEVYVNNYNLNILTLLRANHDIQYVTNPYACVQYVLDYTVKQESGSSKLLKEIEEFAAKNALSMFDKLKALEQAMDKSREVSLPEVIVRLIGLKMTVASRQVKTLVVSKPEERDGLLKSNLEDLEEGESPFFLSTIDYYVKRPVELEELSYAEFCADFTIIDRNNSNSTTTETVIDDHEMDCAGDKDSRNEIYQLQDDIGRIRKRTRRAILKYHINRFDEIEQKRNYLLLFMPFRDENRDIHRNRLYSIDELFTLNIQQIERLRAQFEPSLKLLVDIEHAERVREEEGLDEEPDEFIIEEEMHGDTEVKDFIAKAKGVRDRNVEKLQLKELEKLNDEVDCLNKGQRRIFDEVINNLKNIKDKPFHIFISGEAGTGKSFLMNKIIEASKILLSQSGQEIDRFPVLVLCPTATAANIIGGTTIEGALKMFNKNAYQQERLSPGAEAMLHYDLRHCKLVIMDEISMVGTRKFQRIHERLVEALGNHPTEPFAGLSVICTGDFHQLPPVKDSFIFHNYVDGKRPEHIATNWWTSRFKNYELTEKMRSLSDPEFAGICDRVSVGVCDEEMEDYFQQRVVQNVDLSDEEQFKRGELAILVATNAKVDYWNNRKTNEFKNDDGEIYPFFAKDCVCDMKVPTPDLSQLPIGKTDNLPHVLHVKVNSPIMVTRNIQKDDYLTNGVRGYVAHIDKEDEIIWVRFQEERIGQKTRKNSKSKCAKDPLAVPFKKVTSTFNFGVTSDNVKIKRVQFPLTLSYAITVHKSQGMTLKKVYIDFLNEEGKCYPLYQNGLFYVALSRVKNGCDVMLSAFHKSFIRASKHVLSEMVRLRDKSQYKLNNPQLGDTVFAPVAPNEIVRELKIVYLNINGLLHAKHLNHLRCDRNLTQADLICISEAKVCSEIANDLLQMDNFHVCARLNCPDNTRSQGMIVYRKENVQVDVVTLESLPKQFDNITFLADGIKVTFIYINPQCPKDVLETVCKKVCSSDILMGDCNLDLFTSYGQKQLAHYFNQFKRLENLNMPTHNRGGIIDHIFCSKTFTKQVWATQAHNLYSDHEALICRVGLDDCRLNDQEQEVSNSQKSEENSLPITPVGSMEMSSQEPGVFYEDANINLHSYDLITLNPGRWLNDNVISCYMSLLVSDRTQHMNAVSSFFYPSLQAENLNLARSLLNRQMLIDSHLILFPTHHTNHWFLVVGKWTLHNTLVLTLYDSLFGSKYEPVVQHMKAFIAKEILDPSFVVDVQVAQHVPLQLNDFDCGVFCLMIARFLTSQAEAFPFCQLHMPQLRTQIYRELENKKLEVLRLDTPFDNNNEHLLDVDWTEIRFQNPDGTSCWLNAMVQIFLHLVDEQWQSPLGMLLQSYLHKKCPRKGFNSLPIKRMLCSVKDFHHLLAGQHDPLEFLQCVGESKQFDEIRKVFTIGVEKKFDCSHCENKFVLDEYTNINEFYLSVDITNFPRNKPPTKDQFTFSLAKRFFNHVNETVRCIYCNQLGCMEKEYATKLPQLLFISINRLAYKKVGNNTVFTYRKEKISLPEHIKLTDVNLFSHDYEIGGILQHFGSCNSEGRTSGHYTCVVRGRDRSWYHCNDSIVQLERHTSTIDDNIYIVVYTKI